MARHGSAEHSATELSSIQKMQPMATGPQQLKAPSDHHWAADRCRRKRRRERERGLPERRRQPEGAAGGRGAPRCRRGWHQGCRPTASSRGGGRGRRGSRHG